MMGYRKIILGIAMLATAAVLLQLFRMEKPLPLPPAPPEIADVLLPEPQPLPAFSLVDFNGQTFDNSRLQGKWSLMFFGYANCPDVCPTTMTVLAEVQKILQEEAPIAQTMQVLFISVDPKRDTPEFLKKYVPYFHPAFLGLTGKEGELEKLAKSVGAGYFIEPGQDKENYAVVHPASIFLMDPKGQFVALFQGQHLPRQIAFQLTKIPYYLEGGGGR